ncbi:hypothetical protein F5148DRAFT_202508 [Russula earlei]|uniref:Uncharacterized protein n=1 Tax=Russula earlei TaxID=71964 RepID=A0ACC0ULY0_9AGAM|nr:hypothetical protein F5148DRAFT_202508 [Russula earlei]
MFRFLSVGRSSAPTSANSSTHSLAPQEIIPGGPPPWPESVSPSHDAPIGTRQRDHAEPEAAGAGAHHQSRVSGHVHVDGSNLDGPGDGLACVSSSSPIAPPPEHQRGLSGRGGTVEPPPANLQPRPSQHQRFATADDDDESSSGRSVGARAHQPRSSDAPRENVLRAAEGSPGGVEEEDAGSSRSVASRHPNHALADGDSRGGGAFANGAPATTRTGEGLQQRDKAAAGGKEESVEGSQHLSASNPFVSRDLDATLARAGGGGAAHKDDGGVDRKLSKIIKSEAKADKAALHVALKELAEIQKLQKASIKEDAASHSRHSRALSGAHKAEMKLLTARTWNERSQASLRAAGEVLEASRKHVRETNEMLREKMEEVERIRIHKQADDRERSIKMRSLVGKERTRLSRILRSE